MPRIDQHSPGDFCWVELGTSDQVAAKRFYESLFGWAAKDFPTGPDEVYSMFQLEGRDVSAAYTLPNDMLAHGVPPHWMLYVAVENADTAAARAASLGGQVLRQPFDVFDFGRMAALADPTGAHFCVWQAKKHAGIGVSGDHTFCWADLGTPDRERAGDFYSQLFGWSLGKEDEDPAHGYWHIKNSDSFIGGMLPPAYLNLQAPPHWLIYFAAPNCDAATETAQELGAQVYMKPMTMEDVGRLAVLGDPQGAAFALFEQSRRK